MEPYIHKVQYYETDKMMITHHSNYIRWMEEARVDFLEKIGYGFDKLEEEGISSPVVAVKCKYKATTTFPEDIAIKVFVKEFKGVKLILGYEMRKVPTETLVFVGSSEHCFMDKDGKFVSIKKTNPLLYDKLAGLVCLE